MQIYRLADVLPVIHAQLSITPAHMAETNPALFWFLVSLAVVFMVAFAWVARGLWTNWYGGTFARQSWAIGMFGVTGAIGLGIIAALLCNFA